MQNDRPETGRGRFLWFGLGTLGIALLVLAYVALSWRSMPGFKAAIDTCSSQFCDFTTYYYPMGKTALQADAPVEGFMYSPFIALALMLFAALPMRAAVVVWGILQVGCVAVYLLLFRWLVPAGLRYQLLFALIALTSFPLWHNLSWGQVGIMTTVAVLGMAALLERNRRIAAAGLAGFAASFKFFPLIFLAPLALRRDFRFIGMVILACVAFLILLPGVLMGPGDTLSFYRGLLDSYRASDWVTSNYNSQHLPHVLLRLAGSAGLDLRPTLPLVSLFSLGITALSLAMVYLVQRARLPHADLWGIHLLFLSIPFLLKTSWPVDLVYISFAQAFLIWQVMEGEGETGQRHNVTTGATHASPLQMGRLLPQTGHWRCPLIAVLATSIGLSSVVALQITGSYRMYGAAGAVFWADVLCLVASFALLWRRVRIKL